MRLLQFIVSTTIATAILASTAHAANIDIPPRAPTKEFSVQQNQPGCMRWTNDCINCTRGTDGSPPLCSNPGFACQPKAIRCLGTDIPQSEPRR